VNMERAVGSSYTQHQATRPVLVIGVVLYDLAARDYLPHLGHRDSPLNALIECVLRKLERPACDLRANSISQVHVMNRIKTESSREHTPGTFDARRILSSLIHKYAHMMAIV